MKVSHLIRFALISIFLLTACAGGGELPESEGAMEFSEEEVEQVEGDESEDGGKRTGDTEAQAGGSSSMTFGEDEVDPVDPEQESSDEMEFTEEEVDRDANLRQVMDEFPSSEGWLVTFDPGRMVCSSGVTLPIEAGDDQLISIQWLDNGAALEVRGLSEAGTQRLTLDQHGPGGASYTGSGLYGGEEVDFELVFFTDSPYIEGTIKSQAEGCDITRTFIAERL